MEFFGLTQYGPQSYIKDLLKEGYQEPMSYEEVEPLMKKIRESSTVCAINVGRPDEKVIREIDCYLGRVNGFAYGSFQRFLKMKRKAVIKPLGPTDMYRLPPTTSEEFGWFLCDSALTNETWYLTRKRYPQPSSPNTIILDKVKMNNKYASLF